MLWLSRYDLLFGEHSLVFTKIQSIGFVKNLAFTLYSSTIPNLSAYFLISLLLVSIYSLFNKRLSFIGDVLIWFIVLNIHNKIYPSLTAGDMLINQFLIFNCFISYTFKKSESALNSLVIVLHNMAVTSVIIQICLVYFFAGLSKLVDESWTSGTAIISISQIRHFSIFPSNYSSGFNILYIFLNYLVLFYQLLFPVFVWFKSIKRPLLLVGILMHIYIGFMMGLPEFSAVMIIAYVFFWPQKQTVN